MTHDKTDIAREVERLLVYALKNQMIKEEDTFFLRNQLLDLLDIDEPWKGAGTQTKWNIPHTATPILEKLLDYSAQQNIIPDDTLTYRDLLDTKIMGIVTPLPSEVIHRFHEIKENEGVKAATDDFYRLCQKSNYIRVDRIAKNQKWDYESDYGTLEITINLTKPEKDPKEIAALKNAPQVGYPKCPLCPENVGYAGRINFPARQTHRTLPVKLGSEQWYFQFSPYVYYNQHSILINEEHAPMKISHKTFERFFYFLDQFPHYFIGSNADLPIVGGSILNHDHFQGGSYTLPMENAPIEYSLIAEDYPQVEAGVLHWPMSTLRLKSLETEALVELASEILTLWRGYSDPEANILAQSLNANQETVQHNTITPIARKNKEGLYELDLVFRNNRTSAEFPLGIFHPHPEIHHIKKENIGLIEVMGLFILPGRLKDELEEIKALLMDATNSDIDEIQSSGNLKKHKDWIEEMVAVYGSDNTERDAYNILRNSISKKCVQVLMDAGVFKMDSKGRRAFNKFLETAKLFSNQ